MCLEANRDLTHSELIAVIKRRLTRSRFKVTTERRLSNGRRADVYVEWAGSRIIIEVKTLLKWSLLESAYGKYHTECDYLVMAVPPQKLHDNNQSGMLTWQNELIEKIGLWHVTWEGIVQKRAPERLSEIREARRCRAGPQPSHSAVIAVPGCTAREP